MPGYFRRADVSGVPNYSRRRLGPKAARLAQNRAPVDTGYLRRNILWDIRRDDLRLGDLFDRVPYMRRQEFEHKTKRFFLRRGLRAVRPDIEAARRREDRRTGTLPGAAVARGAAARQAAREAARQRQRREAARRRRAAEDRRRRRRDRRRFTLPGLAAAIAAAVREE